MAKIILRNEKGDYEYNISQVEYNAFKTILDSLTDNRNKLKVDGK